MTEELSKGDRPLVNYLNQGMLSQIAQCLEQAWQVTTVLYEVDGPAVWSSVTDYTSAGIPTSLYENAELSADLTALPGSLRLMIGTTNTIAVLAPVEFNEEREAVLVCFGANEGRLAAELAAAEQMTTGFARVLGESIGDKRGVEDLTIELMWRYEELALVYEVGKGLDLNQTLTVTLNRVLLPVVETMTADFLMLQVPGQVLEKWLPDTPLLDDGMRKLVGKLQDKVTDDTCVVINYLGDNPDLSPFIMGYAHAIVVPLKVDGSSGTVTLLRRDPEKRFFAGDGRLLEGVVGQLATFISTVRVAFLRREMLYASLFGLSRLAESRDPETGEHLQRVSLYCRRLCELMLADGAHADEMDEEFVEYIFRTSPLHDIGKVGIADAILQKPGKLTDEEFDEMKGHAVIGGDTIRDIEKRLHGIGGIFFKVAKEIAYAHHEKWDGSGYPYGLSGSDIPLAARIMALADVYDALSSKRCYKDAFSHEKARDIIIEGRGSHFDPAIVDAFLRLDEEFQEIRRR